MILNFVGAHEFYFDTKFGVAIFVKIKKLQVQILCQNKIHELQQNSNHQILRFLNFNEFLF